MTKLHVQIRAVLFLAAMVIWAAPAALRAETRVLIIAGKGGAPEYTEKFNSYAQRLQAALLTHYQFAPGQIAVLSEQGDAAQHLNCNAQNIEKAFAAAVTNLKAEDQFVIVLFGHGSADGAVSKFNLVGPD